MAFKMNRPIIEGTEDHKASVAKAVSAKLIEKANELGKSDIPHAIDYSLGLTKIERPKKEEEDTSKKKKEETPVEETKEQKAAKLEQERLDQARKNANANQKLREENKPKDTTIKPIEAKNEGKDSAEAKVEPKAEVKTDTSSETNVRKTYDQAWADNDEGIQEKYKGDKKKYKADRLGQKDKDPEKYEEDLYKKTGIKGGPGTKTTTKTTSTGSSSGGSSKGSAATKRDNRIWRNAKKGGPVRKNMLKNGYKPR